MIFDRLTSPVALALLIGVGVVVLLLYWLRPPSPAVTVASTLTWRRLAERSKKTRRWRRLASLLLSLIAAGAMAAALAGLRVAPPGADGPPLVVVVDTSATMATRTGGGPSRLQRAIDGARREIAKSAGPIDLYDTTGQIVRGGLTVANAMRLVGSLEVHPSRSSVFPAAALGGARSGGREPLRLLYSDGVTPLIVPSTFERRSVFQPAINVGIIAFEAARSGSLVQAFVEVLNGSLEPVVAELLLDTAAGEVLVRRPLQLAPAERWSGVIDLAPLAAVVARSPVLRAQVRTENDALALDDRAFAPVPLGSPVRVAVVGPPDTAVRRVLALLDGFSVRSATLEEAGALRSDEADVLVLEEVAPGSAPALPALLIAPPTRSWLPAAEEEIGPSSWSTSEGGAAALDGLRVEAISRYPSPPREDATTGPDRTVLARPVAARETAEATALPLVLRGSTASTAPPWILLPFAVEGSNLPERTSFPTLLEGMLLELAGQEGADLLEAGVLEVGETEVAESDDTFEVESRRFAELEAPTLLDGGSGVARAVAPLGPAASALNHSDWATAVFERAGDGAAVPRSDRSWRHLLLGLALVVAALELWTRSRGITE